MRGQAVTSLMTRAKSAAKQRGQRASTAHLLLVMLQDEPELSELLHKSGVRETSLLNALRIVDEESLNMLDRTLERSRKIAAKLGRQTPTPFDLLLAITKDPRSAGHQSLTKMGTGPQRVTDEVLSFLNDAFAAQSTQGKAKRKARKKSRLSLPEPRAKKRTVVNSRASGTRLQKKVRRAGARRGQKSTLDPDGLKARFETAHPIVIDPFDRTPFIDSTPAPEAQLFALDTTLDEKDFPLLAELGRDLTAAARAGHLDPVIGRDKELDSLLDILARRRGNNPLLLGPPGVGKTALVEGLAQRLIEVEHLSDRTLVEVSAGGLVSGTGVRGALNKRVKQLREEVDKAGGKVILFIDEVHAIMTPGGGPDDLAQELKTALARGELPCIGATTVREYKKHIEKDPALVRRFSPVYVGEPSRDASVEILKGVAPNYAKHHGLEIEAGALSRAVDLSIRFLPDQHLPDKAIAVLDHAGARARRRGRKCVDELSVAEVISEKSGVEVERLLMQDGQRLLELEKTLMARVVGQDEAAHQISDALRKSAAGFVGRRPMGTFLFLGPTGVGKTEMAKAIADAFFPGAPMTRFDMSELSEKHAVARLFGAPPGYIGHDDGGQLTDALRRRPYQLLLLDEIEKAHPEVLLSLLPLLDEGRLTDAKGHLVDATNCIVVMTSNLGAVLETPRSIGFSGGSTLDSSVSTARAEAAFDAAKAAMPPELWGRIEAPLFFSPLGRSSVTEIARRLLRGVTTAMAREGVTLSFDDSLVEALVNLGFDPAYGARPMRGCVSRHVESKLAKARLAGELVEGDRAALSWLDGLVIDKDPKPRLRMSVA